MNKFIIGIVIALLIALVAYILFLNFVKIPKLREDAVFKNILNRKSVRNYISDRTISDVQFEKLLRAGMAAPTARNTQPWEFIVVKDKNTMNAIASEIKSAKMLENASGAIVVLGNLERVGQMTHFWDQDTSAATENILLQAEAMGLGAVWIGVYSIEERVKIISKIFNLPEKVIPLCVISIGYPDGSDKPKDKWNPNNIHYEKY